MNLQLKHNLLAIGGSGDASTWLFCVGAAPSLSIHPDLDPPDDEHAASYTADNAASAPDYLTTWNRQPSQQDVRHGRARTSPLGCFQPIFLLIHRGQGVGSSQLGERAVSKNRSLKSLSKLLC